MNNKLKPCPFCGGKAAIVLKDSSHTGNPSTILNGYVAGCTDCNVCTPKFSSKIWMDEEGGLHIDKNGAEDAANAWNRRANNE